MVYDIAKIRKDFPVLGELVNNRRNCFLDSAASSQKPQSVINKMVDAYTKYYSNVHRGSYHLSEVITLEYENAREAVQNFISARKAGEIIFTRSATESINLVMSTWGRANIKENDAILISNAEHHSNLVPWQVLRDEKKAELHIFNLIGEGVFSMEEFEKHLTPQTKLVAVTAMSNVLGTVLPIKDIIEKAHKAGAKVLIDAAQYCVHHQIDVQYLDCDFLVFSGHKLYGPTGVGVLYAKEEILKDMPPYQYGGEMVGKVTYAHTTYAEAPAKFEAGTPAAVEAIGLGEAVRYIQKIGFENIENHEREISEYARKSLEQIKGLHFIGGHNGIFSFALDNIHPQDLAFILDKEGVSIRTGHHCAEPLVNRYGFSSVARASIGLYTDKEDIDQLISAIKKAQDFFKKDELIPAGFTAKAKGIFNGKTADKEEIIKALKTVSDPEINLNIYDLGLVYNIDIKDNGNIFIDMTLTSPMCPVAGILPQQAAHAVAAVEGANEVEVKIVWEPAWSIDRLSEDAKIMLEML